MWGAGCWNTRGGTSLGEAVWIVIVADVVMSLDTVLGAAHGNLVRSAFGIALSLPLVVWGGWWFARADRPVPRHG